jgi:aryl-alcohol dehydrogenase-like predicted oxidoreductase
LSKLALGTAQFGLDYGVANTAGKVPIKEVGKILELAGKMGVDTIDTAMAYGDSEKVLGSLGVSDFRIVTKLGGLLAGGPNVKGKVRAELENAIKRLGVNSLYGLLLHEPADLFGKDSEILVATLMDLKDMGLVRKVGVSVYEPQELRRLMCIMPPDLVQLPLNLLDRRFEREGLLRELCDQGTEIHARSAFLQGLLLTCYEDIPAKFQRWHKVMKRWDAVKQSSPLSPTALCLSYPLSLPEVDRVVVGVDNLGQLTELLQAECNEAPNVDLSFLESTDPILVNPSKWNTL